MELDTNAGRDGFVRQLGGPGVAPLCVDGLAEDHPAVAWNAATNTMQVIRFSYVNGLRCIGPHLKIRRTHG